ncbi:UNVERIFIED_CONTAM: Oleosin [Sesamum angustifolium]|uniref:Oleosin n=1 Tax=Sesamum angustifolium TaxID=2727405 RepID=A0AAW2LI08_9LAMI
MSDPAITLQDSAPRRSQAVGFLAGIIVICGSLFGLFGLALTGTMITLAIAAPGLVFFSPIIIPAVLSLLLIIAGFMFSGGCLAAALAATVWMCRYMAGKSPLGSEQLDYLTTKFGGKATTSDG